MKRDKFYSGDIVVLRGEAKRMVVESVLLDNQAVSCTWMENGSVIEKTFNAENVEKVNDLPSYKYWFYHQAMPNWPRVKKSA